MADRGQQQRVNEAFNQFRDAFAALLQERARASVDGAIHELAHAAGPFQVEGVEVEVVVRNLKVCDANGTTATPRRGAHPSGTRAGATRGRPGGPVRVAVLETFAEAEAPLGAPEIRAALEERGVEATTDNVHQQLRRLERAGLLQRLGRGRYRPAPETPADPVTPSA